MHQAIERDLPERYGRFDQTGYYDELTSMCHAYGTTTLTVVEEANLAVGSAQSVRTLVTLNAYPVHSDELTGLRVASLLLCERGGEEFYAEVAYVLTRDGAELMLTPDDPEPIGTCPSIDRVMVDRMFCIPPGHSARVDRRNLAFLESVILQARVTFPVTSFLLDTLSSPRPVRKDALLVIASQMRPRFATAPTQATDPDHVWKRPE